ncbi:MAG: hypothetical protein ACK6AD_07595 [Cyanobacteriota bacterium]|jgi:hypothetical protein
MLHNLGRVVAAAAVPHHQITALFDRHAAGDWGELSEDDKAANDEAARIGDGRLFSSYSTAEHGKIWIIADDILGEGEGPITTVMFPEDYRAEARIPGDRFSCKLPEPPAAAGAGAIPPQNSPGAAAGPNPAEVRGQLGLNW